MKIMLLILLLSMVGCASKKTDEYQEIIDILNQ